MSRKKIHGCSKRGNNVESSTYRSWDDMKQRCGNPKHPDYHYYGGRGIKVCKRWLVFANFLEDMGLKPTGLTMSSKRKLYTIERINNACGYEPGNCKWATYKEQAANTRPRRRRIVINAFTIDLFDDY